MKNIFCNFCGHAHTQDEVVLSVLLKGFVTLMGENDGAFGLSCIHPGCEKTFFILGTKGEFQWIVDNIITDPFVAYPADVEHHEKVTETISKSDIEGHIYFLADDVLKGRATGSPELKIAASYLANSFRRYGVKPNPKTGNYYQEVNLKQR